MAHQLPDKVFIQQINRGIRKLEGGNQELKKPSETAKTRLDLEKKIVFLCGIVDCSTNSGFLHYEAKSELAVVSAVWREARELPNL